MEIINYGELIDHGDHLERVPMKIRCDCNAVIELWGSWTNYCYRCSAEYNSGGQRLAPREYWGEETGEHYTECYPQLD